jgi:hypothetical protein
MAASYPGSVKVFTSKTNVTDVIDASHPNTLQEEVLAIESVLGINPNVSTTPSSVGSFSESSQTFSTVGARLANIETGIVADTHTQYLKKSADSQNLITPAANSNIGIVVKAKVGQTANLQEWRPSGSNTPTTYVDASGTLVSPISEEVDNVNALLAFE